MRLKTIVEDTDSRAGRAFDLFISALIIFSLVTFSVETLPDLSDRTRQWLHYAETATVAIFSTEYLLRIAVADRKFRFVFSFYGLIDLAAILPYYLSLGAIDLRSIRALRLFRLFRVFKLIRYSNALRRYRDAFAEIKEALVLFFLATCFLLYIASVGIYYFEREAQPEAFGSVFHCMWWAVATLTTVGYGDVYPITLGGKVFTFVLLMTGLGIVAVPSGLIAAAMMKGAKDRT